MSDCLLRHRSADDITDLYVRDLLFTRGKDITPHAGLSLPTGQVGDYGMFQFTSPYPQTSNQNGAQLTTQELINATCAAADENNLDKIDGLAALASTSLTASILLQGQQSTRILVLQNVPLTCVRAFHIVTVIHNTFLSNS